MRLWVLKVGKERPLLLVGTIGRRQVVVAGAIMMSFGVTLSEIARVQIMTIVILFATVGLSGVRRIAVFLHIPNPGLFRGGDWKIFTLRIQPFAVKHYIYRTTHNRIVIAMIAARGLPKAMGKQRRDRLNACL